ncbi:MAG: zinc-dependent metalloprotease [Alistipes senegalensis]
MKHADEWIGEEDADYTFRSLVQASVMNQLYYAFVSVSANLGGVYLNEKYAGGDALPTYLSVPRDLQRRALRFMLERLEDMSWLDNERLNKDVVEAVSLGEYCPPCSAT